MQVLSTARENLIEVMIQEMEARSWSVAELCERSGISERRRDDMLAGETITIVEIVRIAGAFGLDPAEMMRRAEIPPWDIQADALID